MFWGIPSRKICQSSARTARGEYLQVITSAIRSEGLPEASSGRRHHSCSPLALDELTRLSSAYKACIRGSAGSARISVLYLNELTLKSLDQLGPEHPKEPNQFRVGSRKLVGVHHGRRPNPQHHLLKPRHQVYILHERPEFAEPGARRKPKSSERRM